MSTANIPEDQHCICCCDETDDACPVHGVDPDHEPPEPDGECFRGGEAAAYEAEQMAWIQRNLK